MKRRGCVPGYNLFFLAFQQLLSAERCPEEQLVLFDLPSFPFARLVLSNMNWIMPASSKRFPHGLFILLLFVLPEPAIHLDLYNTNKCLPEDIGAHL